MGVGAMAAILGLEAAMSSRPVPKRREGRSVRRPISMRPTQTVIAGEAAAVERAVEAAKARGARRAIMLKVSAPFHCALMTAGAGRDDGSAYTEATFNNLPIPLVNNVDAALVTAGDAAREGLIRQNLVAGALDRIVAQA